MTCFETTQTIPPTQQKTIIPYNFFSDSYESVLNGIHGVVTCTERKLLSYLAFLAFADGEVYPKRTTIAHRLKITPKQVSRLVTSLRGKGFLSVEKPSLVEKHLFRKTNRYHFLYHPQYDKAARKWQPVHKWEDVSNVPHPMYRDGVSNTGMSPQMSPEIKNSTYNINQRHKEKDKDVLSFFERFRKEHTATGAHPQSIEEAVISMERNWAGIHNPVKYGAHIINIQSGNYYLGDLVDSDKRFKRESRAPVAIPAPAPMRNPMDSMEHMFNKSRRLSVDEMNQQEDERRKAQQRQQIELARQGLI